MERNLFFDIDGAMFGFGGVANPLGEHGGIEPVQGDGGVRGFVPQFVDQGVAALVVVDEDEPFLTLEQSQHVEFAGHAAALDGSRSRSAVCGTINSSALEVKG